MDDTDANKASLIPVPVTGIQPAQALGLDLEARREIVYRRLDHLAKLGEGAFTAEQAEHVTWFDFGKAHDRCPQWFQRSCR
ncbi:hypothetical protein AB4Z34_10400 [Ensifer sp. 2YAB10]|uniref:hypothetical protein n=1 Tax=unclassified Ensifer TaxID=2633371 RepID=UPI003F9364E4